MVTLKVLGGINRQSYFMSRLIEYRMRNILWGIFTRGHMHLLFIILILSPGQYLSESNLRSA